MELYIDPGTGSMLFAILIGIVGAVNFAFRSAWVKIKFLLSGGRAKTDGGGSSKPAFVIFSDDKRYWNVFEPICREMDRRSIDVEYLTVSADDPVFGCDFPHVKSRFLGEGNAAFAKLNTMKAHILLSTTPGLEVYQWKRSPEIDCYVHIFHSVGEAQLYRMFGIDYYDAVLSSGSAQTVGVRQLEELRGLPPKEISVVGAPYMDVLAERLERADRSREENVTILLAPTWGESGIFKKYGDRILEELLSTGYHVIVRPHPQSFISESSMIEKIRAKYPDSDRIEWNRDIDNFEVLRRSDILISDFSGIIFEFALVYDKPVIYASATIDKAPYDAWWVPGKTWTERALPSIGVELEGAMGEGGVAAAIEACLHDPGLALRRQELRADAWSHRGDGTQAAVDYLVGKYAEVANMQCLQDA